PQAQQQNYKITERMIDALTQSTLRVFNQRWNLGVQLTLVLHLSVVMSSVPPLERRLVVGAFRIPLSSRRSEEVEVDTRG
ncbi:MAG: hypothetical protein ACT4QB_05605, partial [Gammaproteobacteria bacterium]